MKKILNKTLISSLPICMFIVNNVYGRERDVNVPLKKFQSEVFRFTGYYYAFTLITVVLVLIILFIKLGGFHSRPFKRYEVAKDIGIVLLCTVLLGAVGLVSKILIGTFFN